MNYLDLLNLSLTLMDFNPFCCNYGFVPVKTKRVSISEKKKGGGVALNKGN